MKRTQKKMLKQPTTNAVKLQAVSADKSTEIHHHIEDAEPATREFKQGESK